MPGLDLVRGVERGLERERGEGLQHMPGDGRVDPQAAGPGAEPALPAADQDAAVALVAGDALGGSAVEHAEPAPADPADRQAVQQRAAFPGGAGPGGAAGRGHVRGQARGAGR